VVVRHWALRDRGWSAWIPLVGAVVLGLLSRWVSGNIVVGLVAAGAVLIAGWRSWIPLTFEIGPSGVTQIVLGRKRRIPWTSILNYQVCLRGVLLLPDAVVTRLSPLRGLYLPWGRQRQEVLANFEYYLQSWAAGRSGRRDSTQASPTASQRR
jgi:hypothetical protein